MSVGGVVVERPGGLPDWAWTVIVLAAAGVGLMAVDRKLRAKTLEPPKA